MKFAKLLIQCCLFVVLAMFASCGQNPVSPDSADHGMVRLSVKGAGSGSVAASGSRQLAKTDNATAVTITSARVVIEKVELESAVRGALDFKLQQPFVQDLVSIIKLQEIDTIDIPFGSYDELKVAVDDLDPEDGDVYTQNPELQGLSILIRGQISDDPTQTFEFSSEISLQVKLSFDPPLEVNETTVTTNIVLDIDYNAWFTDQTGNFIDPNDPGNQEAIERNIRNSFKVFEDKDNDGDPDEDHETKGAIDSLGSDHLIVNGTTFWVNENTVVKDSNKNLISFLDLSEAMFVEVHAVQQDDGSWLALKIEVEDDHNGDDDRGDDNDFETKGPIDSLGSDHLTVNGTTFQVNENTVVKDNNKNLISFSDLSEGMFVEVHAVQQDDGSWLATKIEVEDDHNGDDDRGDDNDFETKGAIDSLGSDHLTVNGTTFWVNENTVVKGNDDQTLSFSDLAVGMIVEIHASEQDDGSWLATKIEVEDDHDGDDDGRDDDDNDFETKGAIDSLGADHLIVNGMAFLIDDNTVVQDHDKNLISFSELLEGMFVEVHAVRQEDGTFLATRIEIEDDHGEDSNLEVKGSIESLGSDHIVVQNTEFFVDDNTRIDSKHGSNPTFSDLTVGMYVEVRASRREDGSLYATRIELDGEHE